MDRFEELIGGLRPALARAFAAAYGLDRGQEALAESLAWASEHRDRVLAMDNPGGYLYRVGQSRSRPRRRREPTVVFPPAPELGLPDIEPALPGALTQLSVRQRVCLALVVVDEWTYQEVADLLGIGRSSVQSHVGRALEKLREAMDDAPRSGVGRRRVELLDVDSVAQAVTARGASSMMVSVAVWV